MWNFPNFAIKILHNYKTITFSTPSLILIIQLICQNHHQKVILEDIKLFNEFIPSIKYAHHKNTKKRRKNAKLWMKNSHFSTKRIMEYYTKFFWRNYTNFRISRISSTLPLFLAFCYNFEYVFYFIFLRYRSYFFAKFMSFYKTNFINYSGF